MKLRLRAQDLAEGLRRLQDDPEAVVEVVAEPSPARAAPEGQEEGAGVPPLGFSQTPLEDGSIGFGIRVPADARRVLRPRREGGVVAEHHFVDSAGDLQVFAVELAEDGAIVGCSLRRD